MTVLFREARALWALLLVDRATRAATQAMICAVLIIIFVYAASSGHAMRLFTGSAGPGVAATLHAAIGLGEDRSMSEIFTYGMAFLSAILFLLAFFDQRAPVLLFLALLMSFVWYDDAAGYHEVFGSFLAKTLNLPELFGLRRQDAGEVLAWALAGLALLPVMLISLARRGSGDLGVFALVMAGFGMLVVFGVLADMVHMVVPPPFDSLMAIVEDGGEMLAIAFIAGVAIGLARNGQAYYDWARGGTARDHRPPPLTTNAARDGSTGGTAQRS